MELNRSLTQVPATGTTNIVSFERSRRSILVGNSDLFSGLSPSEHQKIVESGRPRSFLKGDLFFSQGQPFRRLVLLESGHVKLTRLNRQGREVILAVRGTCDAIDLPVGRPPSPHSCTAQALTSGRTLTWAADEIDAVSARLPKLTENMYRILHRHVDELEKRYHEATTDSVARRLACTLIRLTDQLGEADGDGVEIRISRYELSQMCGMTLFTVSRLISRWAKLDLLVARREALLMLDLERLDALTSSPNSSDEEDLAAL